MALKWPIRADCLTAIPRGWPALCPKGCWLITPWSWGRLNISPHPIMKSGDIPGCDEIKRCPFESGWLQTKSGPTNQLALSRWVLNISKTGDPTASLSSHLAFGHPQGGHFRHHISSKLPMLQFVPVAPCPVTASPSTVWLCLLHTLLLRSSTIRCPLSLLEIPVFFILVPVHWCLFVKGNPKLATKPPVLKYT